ncbi:Proton pump-interactor [Vigna angularis]|uniref:Proton pump-interactor n=1 Tax=Phaseolus angularis TaxID=3914 RepID=A0A8T0KZP5_PHAAN|nr:Proton pump-interactor [Vigna angularis]
MATVGRSYTRDAEETGGRKGGVGEAHVGGGVIVSDNVGVVEEVDAVRLLFLTLEFDFGPAENNAEEDKHVSQDSNVEFAIPFGSHGDESAKLEEEVAPDSNVVPDSNAVPNSNVPKDAAEDWPTPKQIHSYFFVRFRPYDDPIIKANLDKLDKEMSQKNQARIQVTNALRAKRLERTFLISQIKSLRDDNKQF